MPHFILDCSRDLLDHHDRQRLMQTVFDAAGESRLFNSDDIKVRIRPYSEFIVGNSDKASFLHVFAYIMEGRTVSQKNDLSKSIVRRLKTLLPDVPVVSVNVMDFEKATYNNRNTVDDIS